jgi:hypothetical protein
MATWFGEDPACCIFGCILPALAAIGVCAILYVSVRVWWWLLWFAVSLLQNG